MNKSKKITYLIIILILFAVLAYAMSRNKAIQTIAPVSVEHNTGQTPPAPKLVVNKTEVAGNVLPQKFPKDVPLEKGAPLTQDYNATTNDGRFQATVEFVTAKSLADNYDLYKSYMNKSGWKIVVDNNGTNGLKVLAGDKSGAQLQVTMGTNSVTNQNTVSISYSILSK
jgi:hypothetical protein